MFYNLLRTDIERAIHSVGFLIAVLLTFAAFYFSSVVDIRSQQSILYLFNYSMKYSNSQGMIILASSFAYSASFCLDRQSGMLRFIVDRCGKQRYAISKCVSCSLAGGLCVFLGAILYLFILCLFGFGLLPSVTELQVEYSWQAFGSLLLGSTPWLYFVCLLVTLFMQGAFWSALGLCISGYLPNLYIAYCSPFIASFIIQQISSKFILPNWLNPVRLGLARSNYGGVASTLAVTIGAFSIMILLCSVIFIRKVKRRLSND